MHNILEMIPILHLHLSRTSKVKNVNIFLGCTPDPAGGEQCTIDRDS